jgi:hypothetical protein
MRPKYYLMFCGSCRKASRSESKGGLRCQLPGPHPHKASIKVSLGKTIFKRERVIIEDAKRKMVWSGLIKGMRRMVR